MQKIAIIGASYLQQPLVEKAKDMGVFSICFAWQKDAVCADVCDRFYPISIVEKEKILEICQQEQVDGICTIASDVAAPTVAFVAEKMGLPGNTHQSAVKANNKFLMREAFIKGNVPCPWYKMVTSPDGINPSSLPYPLIVKPSDRSGSLGVEKVNNSTQLISAINKAVAVSFKKQAMVEEYIEGREISVEFISYKGLHYPLTITDKITTEAPHFVELEHHQPSTLSQKMYSSIYEITQRALSSLGITDGASHSEFKITADGRIYIMEIGARMGGDFIGSDLVRLSTGYDFLKGVIDTALGCFSVPQKTLAMHSGIYFLCEETKRLLPYFQEESIPFIVKKEKTGNQLNHVTCSGDRNGYLIYQSDHLVCL